jgi:hypothetical protein
MWLDLDEIYIIGLATGWSAAWGAPPSGQPREELGECLMFGMIFQIKEISDEFFQGYYRPSRFSSYLGQAITEIEEISEFGSSNI